MGSVTNYYWGSFDRAVEAAEKAAAGRATTRAGLGEEAGTVTQALPDQGHQETMVVA